jgi:hypothetical protein
MPHKCRVGRVVPNPKEVVIKVVGDGYTSSPAIMGKPNDELRAGRFAYGTVRSSIASAIGARSFKDCRCRLSEAMQTQCV